MSNCHRRIWESGSHRVVEHKDEGWDWVGLKGDTFKADLHPEIALEELKRQEREFEQFVGTYGVFGYVLEHWDGAVDCGWTHIDSCWGLVGEFSETDIRFRHTVVFEMIGRAAALERVKIKDGC